MLEPASSSVISHSILPATRSVGQTKAIKIAIRILKVFAFGVAFVGSIFLAVALPPIGISLFSLLLGYAFYKVTRSSFKGWPRDI
jgi:hypothetical protein